MIDDGLTEEEQVRRWEREEFFRLVGMYFAETANANGTQRRIIHAMKEARRRVREIDDFAPTVIDNIKFQLLLEE